MKHRYIFTLDPEAVERFRSICAKNDRSMSSTINLFMKAYTGYDEKAEIEKYVPATLARATTNSPPPT